MKRAWVVVLACLAGCADEPIEERSPPVALRAQTAEVSLGAPFSLTVVRVWPAGRPPAPFEGDSLAPLVVQLLETTSRADSLRVEETSRFRAWAFQPGTLTIRCPGAQPLVLRVQPALADGDPIVPEFPGEPLELPAAWSPWWIGGAGMALVAVLLWRRRHRPEPEMAGPPPPAPPTPLERAMTRLQRLRTSRPSGPAELGTFHVEAADLMREYVAARFAVPAPEMTTQEILAAVSQSSQRLDLLGTCLQRCDLVKFARHLPGDPELEELLDTVAAFLSQNAARENGSP